MATISTNSNLLVPIATRLLPSILTTAKKIVDKIEQAKINKQHCQTLIEHIETVISYLKKPELLKRLQSNNSPLNQTLSYFEQFLEKCYNFVSYYVDRSRIRKFISSNSYKEQFNFFNNQLQMYYCTLTLGINIENSNQNAYLCELLIKLIEQEKIIPNQFEKHLAIQRQLNYISTEQSTSSNDILKNGIWSNRCFEYGQWHGPFLHQITFNFNDNTVHGHGKDHIGTFILTGSFSKETQKINIVLSYKSNSENLKLKMNDQYSFQLAWNEKLGLFDGLKYEPIESEPLSGGLFEMSFVQAAKDS